ncbi:MAG: hypothetical protein KGM24_06360, partial [Elusimicrobia bacterium]|nr:hypothetical protein [Elusimicrobiota bacterium]
MKHFRFASAAALAAILSVPSSAQVRPVLLPDLGAVSAAPAGAAAGLPSADLGSLPAAPALLAAPAPAAVPA